MYRKQARNTPMVRIKAFSSSFNRLVQCEELVHPQRRAKIKVRRARLLRPLPVCAGSGIKQYQETADGHLYVTGWT